MGMPRATHATRVSRSEERGESAWTAKAGIEGPFDFVKLGLQRATWMTRRNRISTSVFHGFEKKCGNCVKFTANTIIVLHVGRRVFLKFLVTS